MRLGNFALEIPQGYEWTSGYVEINHNTKYTIDLSNFSDLRCDAEVEVDGKLVGVWRIPSKERIALERPAHDTGRFTFYQFNTPEAKKAGLLRSEKLGLISVLFKPEKPYVRERVLFSIAKRAGGTGLSGESKQKFYDVPPLNYDEAGFVLIHLRLGCETDEPRPLTPASTPVPPPLF